MNVLSLFDGIATGRYCLEKAGIKVDKYYASEVDESAISIAMYNYPDIIQLGDVERIDFNSLKGSVDLLIGGFPCTQLSIMGNREGLAGKHSRLFYKQLEAIQTIKPKYFLVENNVGMPKEDYEEITKQLGCYPVEINSALLSGQSRKRYYWTNIGPQRKGLIGFPKSAIPQPEDKGIVIADILENGTSAPINRINSLHCIDVPETVRVRKHEVDIESLKTLLRSHKKFSSKVIAEKLNIPLTQAEHWFRTDDYFAIPDAELWYDLKALLKIETDSFDRAIVDFEEKPAAYEKATRKYDVNGKMSTLLAGGNDEIILQGNKCTSVPCRVFNVKDGFICLDEKVPIELADGEYTVRPLTPLECERLQTMPDHYTKYGKQGNETVEISKGLRYKALGNGWTADVITYIFSFMKEYVCDTSTCLQE